MPSKNPELIKKFHDRQKIKDRERYQRLIRLGGSRCVLCGVKENLTLDHAYGFKEKGRRTIARYERDFQLGRIRILCRSCNSSDGNWRMRLKRFQESKFFRTTRNEKIK